MNALALNGFNAPAVLTSEPAEAEKRRLLDEALTIRAVGNDLEAELAGQTLVALRGLSKQCEDSRKLIKDPVLKLGRQIDAMASAFVADLDSAATRIGRLVADYQAEQQRRAEEADRARQAELNRIELERRAAEERARREAAAAIAAATTPEAAEAVAQQADKAQAEAAKLAQSKAEAANAAVMPAPVKLAGVSVRPVWKFEVLDIRALHAARPDLVELQPRRAEINAAIAAGSQEIPGLRIWQENTTRVRA